VGFTVIAFIDLQIKDGDYWENRDEYREDGVLKVIKNDAEIHLVAVDGTFRQLFFAKNAIIRIVGNAIWFNSKDTDYLITDHSKKFPNNKRIDE